MKNGPAFETGFMGFVEALHQSEHAIRREKHGKKKKPNDNRPSLRIWVISMMMVIK